MRKLCWRVVKGTALAQSCEQFSYWAPKQWCMNTKRVDSAWSTHVYFGHIALPILYFKFHYWTLRWALQLDDGGQYQALITALYFPLMLLLFSSLLWSSWRFLSEWRLISLQNLNNSLMCWKALDDVIMLYKGAPLMQLISCTQKEDFVHNEIATIEPLTQVWFLQNHSLAMNDKSVKKSFLVLFVQNVSRYYFLRSSFLKFH